MNISQENAERILSILDLAPLKIAANDMAALARELEVLSKFGIDVRQDLSPCGINKRQGKKGPRRRNRKHRRR